MTTLQRLTTQYIKTEDRLRLAGEDEAGGTQVLWITQRLLCRLVRVLCEWLEQHGDGQVMPEVRQSFEQLAARTGLVPQPAVCVSNEVQSWLVQSVDIGRSNHCVNLRFIGPAGQTATLTLFTKPLRQWLSIVIAAYRQAEWPMEVWPEWMGDDMALPGLQRGVLH